MNLGDLIVIKGNTIVFSTEVFKPNALSIKYDLSTFMSPYEERFYIPIGVNNTNILPDLFTDIEEAKRSLMTGPIGLVLYKGQATELVNRGHGNIEYICLMSHTAAGRDTKSEFTYVRSNSFELESAATAGGVIYDDPVKVYEEAYKAVGANPPSFYSGQMGSITAAVAAYRKSVDAPLGKVMEQIKTLEAKEQTVIVKRELKKLKARETGLFQWNDNFRVKLYEVMKLTRHNAL